MEFVDHLNNHHLMTENLIPQY